MEAFCNLTSTLDPKSVKEELMKLLDKEDSTEKLFKLVKSLILNLSAAINASSNLPAMSPLASKQQQHQQQQNQNQQNEINCVILLGIVISKRPQLFIKQASLTEVCDFHNFLKAKVFEY
jgi:hypothetical protein